MVADLHDDVHLLVFRKRSLDHVAHTTHGVLNHSGVATVGVEFVAGGGGLWREAIVVHEVAEEYNGRGLASGGHLDEMVRRAHQKVLGYLKIVVLPGLLIP